MSDETGRDVAPKDLGEPGQAMRAMLKQQNEQEMHDARLALEKRIAARSQALREDLERQYGIVNGIVTRAPAMMSAEDRLTHMLLDSYERLRRREDELLALTRARRNWWDRRWWRRALDALGGKWWGD